MNAQVLWSPSEDLKSNSNLAQFCSWLKERKNLAFKDYQPLWEWSTNHPDAFWESVWEYFEIIHDGSYQEVLSGNMPNASWFSGTRLNYAEHIFRQEKKSTDAIIFKSETEPLRTISWASLRQQVCALQGTLLRAGVTQGDHVAAYLPCIPEATIAFLAANSIGAIWSSCSPDFGAQSVIDRFSQTKPKVLIAATRYVYGGKSYDSTAVVDEVVQHLPGLSLTICLSDTIPPTLSGNSVTWKDSTTTATSELKIVRVPFNHPIWVVYSSGTTGLPKAITHSHGGILLEHLKYLTFHNDVKPGEKCFWYTTTGWMMWNYIQSSLLCGATLVLYDGHPGFPDLNVMWKFTEEAGIQHFGTSAGFILACIKERIHPSMEADLSVLRSIGSTGSTLPPEGFEWIYREVKKDIWLASMSGGTDVATAFVGGNPTWPVYSGEIQCRALGCKLESFNEEGKPVLDEVGEMVITQPMPSMPVFFWNDPDFKRYKESYFEMYANVWRHGDWIKITPANGVIIYGRSDATLNRGGVRIGTSEIYRAVDKVADVRDSLVVCIEKDKGEFFMPLFVQLQSGVKLTDELRQKINRVIRQDYSPRHVPDQIIAVPEIPYTISGKKTETPIKKILMGRELGNVVSTGSLRNPESLQFFVDYYKTILSIRS